METPPPVASKLFQINEDDLAELERILPQWQDAFFDRIDNRRKVGTVAMTQPPKGVSEWKAWLAVGCGNGNPTPSRCPVVLPRVRS